MKGHNVLMIRTKIQLNIYSIIHYSEESVIQNRQHGRGYKLYNTSMGDKTRSNTFTRGSQRVTSKAKANQITRSMLLDPKAHIHRSYGL